jgi:hypothetical protein
VKKANKAGGLLRFLRSSGGTGQKICRNEENAKFFLQKSPMPPREPVRGARMNVPEAGFKCSLGNVLVAIFGQKGHADIKYDEKASADGSIGLGHGRLFQKFDYEPGRRRWQGSIFREFRRFKAA